jgi:hypothetical protein
MEEEARQILKAALLAPSPSDADLAQRIRARFTAFGDVTLPTVEREPVRPPPDFGPGKAASARLPAVKTGRKVSRG